MLPEAWRHPRRRQQRSPNSDTPALNTQPVREPPAPAPPNGDGTAASGCDSDDKGDSLISIFSILSR